MSAHFAVSPLHASRFPSSLYPFQTAQLPVPGAVMSYVDEGSGSPVLLVHGNPTWSFYYRRLIPALSRQQRVIAPDHIGCGLSTKPQHYPYTLATHIENLGRLIDQLNVAQIDLVLHDWGGAIGLGWAVRNPERVRRIVLLNTAAFLSPRIPWRIALCRYPILGDLAVRGLNAFAAAATFMAVERPMEPAVRDGFLFPYRSWADRVAIQHFVRDIPLSPRHPTWALIDAIDRDLLLLRDRPMLILWGGRDWCFSDYFLADWLTRFPAAEVARFDDAGHYLLEDAHAEVVPRVVRFLA